ncbi:hypothetical protein K239x_07280 [Planctomycetes bacterium K23_9]|uniref:Uncharacterized protein n=1 Tax=Stieleria marina TaxID=1930275 RepID=A0A517NNT4_9BACT|nr:hypothetical protein K239x_07280 [Planctomycetes bacterium K23_9]
MVRENGDAVRRLSNQKPREVLVRQRVVSLRRKYFHASEMPNEYEKATSWEPLPYGLPVGVKIRPKTIRPPCSGFVVLQRSMGSDRFGKNSSHFEETYAVHC